MGNDAMRRDLKRPEAWPAVPQEQRPAVPSEGAPAHYRLKLEAPFAAPQNDDDARRLWALGVIAAAPNISPLYGACTNEERQAACDEIRRIAKLPERVAKGVP